MLNILEVMYQTTIFATWTPKVSKYNYLHSIIIYFKFMLSVFVTGYFHYCITHLNVSVCKNLLKINVFFQFNHLDYFNFLTFESFSHSKGTTLPMMLCKPGHWPGNKRVCLSYANNWSAFSVTSARAFPLTGDTHTRHQGACLR